MLFFRSVTGNWGARRERLIESCRAAQDDLLMRGDIVMVAPGAASNLRLPGSTGFSELLGNRLRADRARRNLTSYLDSLDAKR